MRLGHLVFLLPVLPVFCTSRPPSIQAAEKKAFDVHSLVVLQRASQPVLSPSGQHVAFVLRTTDMDANRGRTSLWVMRSTGAGLKQLTQHETSDWNPTWISDKTVAFLSARSGKPQVHAIDIDGGEARKLTDLPVAPENISFSRDGLTLFFSAEVYPDCDTIKCSVDRDEAKKTEKTTGMVFDKLFFRHWDQWNNGKRNHLFAMRLPTSEPVDLLKGIDADCPTRPFGGSEDYSVSPDGKTVAISMKLVLGSGEAWSTNEDIWLVPSDGSGPPKSITTHNEARDSQPVFSPDGKFLAYLAMKRPGYEADRYRVVLVDTKTSVQRVLTEDWDRSPHALVFGRSNDKLWVTADHLGQHSIFSIDVRSGKVSPVIKDGTNQYPMPTDNGLIFLRNSLTAPADFWTASTTGANAKQVTELNRARVNELGFGEPMQFKFKGAHGDEVYGYVVKPVGFERGKKYPVAFLIHGGPQGSFGNMFHYRWNPQTYAGRGYAAVMIDFHGSTGYGQAFTDAIRGDWGGAPYEDLMKGLDEAGRQFDWLDTERTCALGASYGGYMINWIAGNTQRFKCLVAHSGNLDERMAYFDTEELWFPEWEHGGTPWDNPEGYTKHNPIDHVKNWKTPTLVVHGGLDYRVVDTQGMSVFTALQRKGVPSKFLYFPDENHWILKPHNSILWHDTVLNWLDQWLKPKS